MARLKPEMAMMWPNLSLPEIVARVAGVPPQAKNRPPPPSVAEKMGEKLDKYHRWQ